MSTDKNVHVRIGAVAIVAVALALVVAYIWWRDYGFEEWQRRRYFPRPAGDGCRLLDNVLGVPARDRVALLGVLRWQYREDGRNPYGLGKERFFDVRHQALIRLMALQAKPLPPADENTTGIDHPELYVESESPERIVIIGTPSLMPDYYERPWEGYYRMETLVFSREGRLVSRSAYHDLRNKQATDLVPLTGDNASP